MEQLWVTIRQQTWDHLRSCLKGLGGMTDFSTEPEFLGAEKGELHLLVKGTKDE